MNARRTLLLLAAIAAPGAVGGCFSPNSTTCQGGLVCPPGSRCDDARHRCIPAVQELACVGLAENAGCTYANAPGGCRGGVCELASMTCVAPEGDCHDGWDNDCDGLQDGADPDCAGKVAEQCANLADDDGDGKTDCADPDCAEFPSCRTP